MQLQAHTLILIKKKKEDPKFEVGDHASISKHKNIFVEVHTRNQSKDKN